MISNLPANNNFRFLIVGAGRGGTSLLTGLLDAHPDLEVGFEVGAVDFLMGKAIHERADNVPDRRAHLFASACREAADRHPDSLWGNKVTTEQILGPHDQEQIDVRALKRLLDKLFNQVLSGIQVVFIVRDGRACIGSKVRRTGQSMDSACLRWRNSVNCLRYFNEHHSDNLCVRFEDLLARPEAVLSEICTYLGVPYRAQMLDGVNSPKLPREYRLGALDRSKAAPASVPGEILHQIREDLGYCGYLAETDP